MKRTPIRRKTPLKRTGYIRRKTTPEAKAKRAAKYERDFGDLAEHVRGLPCAACGALGPSDPAHVKSRGAGGRAWLDNGDSNLLPFCRTCHQLQHLQGWSSVLDGGREEAARIARSVGELFVKNS